MLTCGVVGGHADGDAVEFDEGDMLVREVVPGGHEGGRQHSLGSATEHQREYPVCGSVEIAGKGEALIRLGLRRPQ